MQACTGVATWWRRRRRRRGPVSEAGGACGAAQQPTLAPTSCTTPRAIPGPSRAPRTAGLHLLLLPGLPRQARRLPGCALHWRSVIWEAGAQGSSPPRIPRAEAAAGASRHCCLLPRIPRPAGPGLSHHRSPVNRNRPVQPPVPLATARMGRSRAAKVRGRPPRAMKGWGRAAAAQPRRGRPSAAWPTLALWFGRSRWPRRRTPSRCGGIGAQSGAPATRAAAPRLPAQRPRRSCRLLPCHCLDANAWAVLQEEEPVAARRGRRSVQGTYTRSPAAKSGGGGGGGTGALGACSLAPGACALLL